MKSLFVCVVFVAMAGSSSARSTLQLPSPYVVPSEQGNFILRVEPPAPGGASQAVVFRYDAKGGCYEVHARFTSSILAQNIQNKVVIIPSDSDGTIFYLNKTYRAGEERPLICVFKSDGTIVVQKKLSEILPPAEVTMMSRASDKAQKDGLSYDWVESVAIMADGSYWLRLEEAHREAKTEFFGDFLFISSKSWEITRDKESDLGEKESQHTDQKDKLNHSPNSISPGSRDSP